MRWGKHQMNARHDEKMAMLLDRYGAMGYGMYWLVFEIVGEKVTDKCTEAKYPEGYWRRNLSTTTEKLKKLFDCFEELGLFEVKREGDQITVSCPNILKYCDEYTDRQIKKTESVGTKSVPRVRAQIETEIEEEIEREEEEESPSPSPPQGVVEPKPQAQVQVGFEEVVESYHRLLPELPRYRLASRRDVANFAKNVKQDGQRGRAEFWSEQVFLAVKRSSFLLGQSGKSPPKGSRGKWRASLPWLLKPEVVANIINEKYPADLGPEKEYASEIHCLGA